MNEGFKIDPLEVRVTSASLKIRNLWSISSTFFKKVFCAQIPKAQKDTDDLTGPSCVKAARKYVGEIDPWRYDFLDLR